MVVLIVMLAMMVVVMMVLLVVASHGRLFCPAAAAPPPLALEYSTYSSSKIGPDKTDTINTDKYKYIQTDGQAGTHRQADI